MIYILLLILVTITISLNTKPFGNFGLRNFRIGGFFNQQQAPPKSLSQSQSQPQSKTQIDLIQQHEIQLDDHSITDILNEANRLEHLPQCNNLPQTDPITSSIFQTIFRNVYSFLQSNGINYKRLSGLCMTILPDFQATLINMKSNSLLLENASNSESESIYTRISDSEAPNNELIELATSQLARIERGDQIEINKIKVFVSKEISKFTLKLKDVIKNFSFQNIELFFERLNLSKNQKIILGGSVLAYTGGVIAKSAISFAINRIILPSAVVATAYYALKDLTLEDYIQFKNSAEELYNKFTGKGTK